MIIRHRFGLWVVVGIMFASVLSYLVAVQLQNPNNVPAAQKQHPAWTMTAKEQQFFMMRNPSTGEIPNGIYAREQRFMNTSQQALKKKGSGIIQHYNWLHRGPWHIGGRTRALALDASNETTLLAGAATGGMWRSINRGASWVRTSSLRETGSVTCVAQDVRPGHTQTWYYGTGEYIGSGGIGGNGMMKSTDGGKSWIPITSTRDNIDFFTVHTIAVQHSVGSADILYAATYRGIFRSSNGGATWSKVLSNGTSVASWNWVTITPSGTVYAGVCGGGTQGIFRSTDGIRWMDITPTKIRQTLPTTGVTRQYARIVFGVVPSNPDKIFALVYTSTAIAQNPVQLMLYSYHTGDGSGTGGIWEDRTTGLPAGYNSQGGYNLSIAVHPSDELQVILGGVYAYRSTDGFRTRVATQLLSDGLDGLDHHTFSFSPTNPDLLYAGCDQGIKTIDLRRNPTGWNFLTAGYHTAQFYALAIDPEATDNETIIGGMQDNSTFMTRSLAPDLRWTYLNGGDGGFCALVNNARTAYTSAQVGQIWRDTLDGSDKSFIRLGSLVYTETGTRIDPLEAGSPLFINPFCLDPNNSGIMYYPCGRDLWYMNNLYTIPVTPTGTTYDRKSGWTRFPDIVPPESRLSAITATKGKSTRLYLGTWDGLLYKMDNAEQLTPASIQNISTGKGLPGNAYVSCIAANPDNPDSVFVVFSNYGVQSLFFSPDAGKSWQPVAGNLEENPDGSGAGPSCLWLSMLKVRGVWLYLLGTSSGLFSTTNIQGSKTIWQQEATDIIGNTIVQMVVTRQSDGLVAVATHGLGVVSTNITALPTSVAAHNTDDDLLNITPQPVAQAQARITYTLRQATTIQLSIIDLQGKIIFEIPEQYQTPGSHDIFWRTSGITSGTYLCRLLIKERPGFSIQRTKSILVVR